MSKKKKKAFKLLKTVTKMMVNSLEEFDRNHNSQPHYGIVLPPLRPISLYEKQDGRVVAWVYGVATDDKEKTVVGPVYIGTPDDADWPKDVAFYTTLRKPLEPSPISEETEQVSTVET